MTEQTTTEPENVKSTAFLVVFGTAVLIPIVFFAIAFIWMVYAG